MYFVNAHSFIFIVSFKRLKRIKFTLVLKKTQTDLRIKQNDLNCYKTLRSICFSIFLDLRKN